MRYDYENMYEKVFHFLMISLKNNELFNGSNSNPAEDSCLALTINCRSSSNCSSKPSILRTQFPSPLFSIPLSVPYRQKNRGEGEA